MSGELEVPAIGARNGFSRRFAIRLPDGSLYTGADPRAEEKAAQAAAEYYSMPSPARDMMGGLGSIFGIGVNAGPPAPPKPPRAVIFDTRDEAEKLYRSLCDKAAAVGVHNWGGAIVEQLCTPFTSGDPAAAFVEAVTDWIAQNGGER